MTLPAGQANPLDDTVALETALHLARLVVKAHGSVAPREIARELLAALLTASGAARGVLALTQTRAGTLVGMPRDLAVYDVEIARIPALVVQAEAHHSDHPASADGEWMHLEVPLGEQALQPHGGQDRDTVVAHMLLQWDEAHADGARIRGQAAISALRDPITAVFVSVLAAERQIELERMADVRLGDHLNAELLGTVSHELRSPLAAIKGYASTLLRHERRLAREERHEFLAAIAEASDRLEVIINRLLEMSQLETGTALLHRDPLDLVAVARDAINDQRTQSVADSRPPVTLTLAMRDADGRAAEREPPILADARAMRELLDNLLHNAVKYSPHGGEVSVEMQPVGGDAARGAPAGAPGSRDESAERMPQPNVSGDTFLEVVVRDHGVGIPTEHLGRIFDRFHRVDTRLTREVDGLGIGLAICRRLVELHGGAIWAESDPGVGSAFHVLLPITTAIEQ